MKQYRSSTLSGVRVGVYREEGGLEFQGAYHIMLGTIDVSQPSRPLSIEMIIPLPRPRPRAPPLCIRFLVYVATKPLLLFFPAKKLGFLLSTDCFVCHERPYSFALLISITPDFNKQPSQTKGPCSKVCFTPAVEPNLYRRV